MKSNWDMIFNATIVHEGGYVDHPRDPGGATNLGITIGTLSRWLGRKASKGEVAALSRDAVKPIYKQFYWDLVKGDELEPGLDFAVYDFAVNSGPARAGRYLQIALNAVANPDDRLTVDGVVGPHTLLVAEGLTGQQVAQAINRLCDDRLAFLKRLKTWSTFGKGWSRRVAAVRSKSLRMSVSPVMPVPEKYDPAVDGETPPATRIPQQEREISKPENKRGLGAILAFLGTVLSGLLGQIGALPVPVAIALMVLAGAIGAAAVWWLMRNFGDEIRGRVRERLS